MTEEEWLACETAEAMLERLGADVSERKLRHYREPGTHARGCWVVDLVLGKE